MEFTLSRHALDTLREREILLRWVTETMSNPERLEADPGDDQLAHALKAIPEFGGRVLRVIYNRDRQPVHVVTAFFDRAMKGKL
ncbi:MAG: DUF4258 domain-containing protein [Rhodocyclaceae bacterium]|nr:DUF4258 domain-containing protein [Rhodocyclaceae bacterium]